jgi:hypothetical protein
MQSVNSNTSRRSSNGSVRSNIPSTSEIQITSLKHLCPSPPEITISVPEVTLSTERTGLDDCSESQLQFSEGGLPLSHRQVNVYSKECSEEGIERDRLISAPQCTNYTPSSVPIVETLAKGEERHKLWRPLTAIFKRKGTNTQADAADLSLDTCFDGKDERTEVYNQIHRENMERIQHTRRPKAGSNRNRHMVLYGSPGISTLRLGYRPSTSHYLYSSWEEQAELPEWLFGEVFLVRVQL